MTDPAFRQIVEFSESRLRSLGKILDQARDVDPSRGGPIPILLAARCRGLFEAVDHTLNGPSEAAAHILIRSMADLAITTAWIRLNPDVHSELWEGEQARQQAAFIEALKTQREFRPDLPPLEGADELRGRLEAIAAKARARAIHEKVPGVVNRSDRPVMPSLASRQSQIGTMASFEAYKIVVAWFSEWTHSGKGSFLMVDGTISEKPGDPADYPLRALAAGFYAYTLAEVSRWLDLGMHDELDALRRGIMGR